MDTVACNNGCLTSCLHKRCSSFVAVQGAGNIVRVASAAGQGVAVGVWALGGAWGLGDRFHVNAGGQGAIAGIGAVRYDDANVTRCRIGENRRFRNCVRGKRE